MNYKLLALLFVFPFTNVFANNCPELAGSFVCKFERGGDGVTSTKSVKITQQVQNKITTYFINGSERIADNNWHNGAPIEGLSDVQYTATCDDSANIHLNANVLNSNGDVLGTLSSDLMLYKMDKLLRYVEFGTYELDSGYSAFNNEADCQPAN